jgi:hypothetical protein
VDVGAQFLGEESVDEALARDAALASDSPVTKRTWPEFYTGS